MHETAFANAMLPRRAAVLKMPLRPYSLGHEIWLTSRNNPLAIGGEPSRIHIQQAVLICCLTHEELLKLETDWLLSMKVWVWKRRIRKEDTARAIAEFKNYMAAGSTEPETLSVPSQGESSHRPGAPFILRLLQFLVFKKGMSEADAMDYPLGLAKWHYCAYWESEAGLRIKNEDDYKSERIMRRSEELVAAGMELGDAFRTARDEEEAQ